LDLKDRLETQVALDCPEGRDRRSEVSGVMTETLDHLESRVCLEFLALLESRDFLDILV